MTGESLEILAIGANPRSSSAETRERLFIPEEELPAALDRLRAAGLTQAILLSTCDRTEVQTVASDPETTASAVRRVLAEVTRVPEAEFHEETYALSGATALRHVLAVASSLDSITIGEPQVLGQVKTAHRLSAASGLMGPELDSVLSLAYQTAKRVRTETAIGERPVGLAAAALSIGRDVQGDLTRCAALLIGTGEMGELLADQFLRAGVQRVTVAHRRPIRAEAVARRLGCHHAEWPELSDRRAEMLAGADIVISALGTGRAVLDRLQVEAGLKRRRWRPMFLLDAAVPTDLDQSVNELDEAYVYDLDDLERIALDGRSSREAASAAAWEIIDANLDSFLSGQSERAGVPVVRALRDRFEEIRQAVVAEVGGDDRADRATRLLLSRLLHGPSHGLREMAARAPEDLERATEILSRLFALRPDAEGGTDDEAEGSEPPAETPARGVGGRR